jgi:RNA polymerase sigma-70 factor (ECF subfamily)
MRSTTTKPDGANDRLERSLMKGVARGDRDAFDEVFRRYHPQLFRFAYRLTSSYGLAEEVANDVLVTVWQSAATYRGDARVSSWIFGIAYRCSLKGLRRIKYKSVALRNTDLVDHHADATIERDDWLGRAIDELPAKQKLTVMLVYFAGLTCEETAVATNVPVGTVRTRMFHARKKLQLSLGESAVPTREQGNI